MWKFLKKSYPFNNDLIHNAKVVFFISVVVGSFLFFFEPFNFNEFSTKDKLTVSLVISLITFSILSLNMIVLPSYFKRIFDIQHWTVYKEILWNTWLFISVSIGYGTYFKINPVFDISTNIAAEIIFIGIFVISILVILNQNRLVKLNLNTALELNEKLVSKLNSEAEEVLFESEYKKDEIYLNPHHIRILKSAGNYVEIYYVKNEKLHKHLVRNTLKNIENSLKKYGFIFKCHRTFLINTNYIEKAEGSPQGVRLKIKNIDFLVPVSKSYINKLKEII